MKPAALLRSNIKAARKRGALWVRVFDLARLLRTPEGRMRLWTRVAYGDQVHQTSPDTADERYPELFDLVATLKSDAERVLSFGCSTGEELVSLRRRFPRAQIVGAEINPRSRRLAKRRVAGDPRSSVVEPGAIAGPFDVIFALSVLQREPHKIAEMKVDDLSSYYPFERFDAAVGMLVGNLRRGGLLCVFNAQYRIEDSSAAALLEPVAGAPLMDPVIFGADGWRLSKAEARTIFRKAENGA